MWRLRNQPDAARMLSGASRLASFRRAFADSVVLRVERRQSSADLHFGRGALAPTGCQDARPRQWHFHAGSVCLSGLSIVLLDLVCLHVLELCSFVSGIVVSTAARAICV